MKFIIPLILFFFQFNVAEDVNNCEAIIAHFVAHINEPIAALAFDPSGMLLITVGAQGHTFHVFRILNHPCGAAQAAAHHLYVLYRGDTVAKVKLKRSYQRICM